MFEVHASVKRKAALHCDCMNECVCVRVCVWGVYVTTLWCYGIPITSFFN